MPQTICSFCTPVKKDEVQKVGSDGRSEKCFFLSLSPGWTQLGVIRGIPIPVFLKSSMSTSVWVLADVKY